MQFDYTLGPADQSRFSKDAFDSQVGHTMPLTNERHEKIGTVRLRKATVRPGGREVDMTFEVDAPVGVTNSLVGDVTGVHIQAGVINRDLHF